MQYCIIGLGFIYPRHDQAVKDNGGEIILTCDIDQSKNPDFTNYLEMFKSDKFKNEVDAIIIATPNHLHKQMIKDSLATGKKVLCEKPLILDNDFSGLEGVNVVLQLRYHSLIPAIKEALRADYNKIDLIMKVYRDEAWWQSWRGDEKKSGGILMGLAIHMFDFLIFILGNKYRVVDSENSRKKCTGTVVFSTATVNYYVEVLDSREGQTRRFIINDQEFELCDKDNLSFAGYHNLVHQEFINNKGIPLNEAKKAIGLILDCKK